MSALSLFDPIEPAALVPPLVTLRAEAAGDEAAREALLDAAMGPGRVRKASEALRRGRLPAAGLSLVAVDGRDRLVGTVRLWHVVAGRSEAGPVPALLLGPLAVAPGLAGMGIGGRLVRRAVAEAASRGHSAILLVGDAPYYARFGFDAAATGDLAMPGPYERHRLLARELTPGALAGARGAIEATGRPAAGPAEPREQVA